LLPKDKGSIFIVGWYLLFIRSLSLLTGYLP